jgi:flagellar hook assembly protein FlgD
VRQLVRERHLGSHRRVRLRWHGRTDAGTPAPEGTYTVRVSLRRRGRTIDLLERTRLRRVPPRTRAERRG